MDVDDSDALARHAFCEQRNLNLSWYAAIKSARDYLTNANGRDNLYPSQLRNQLRERFVTCWQGERRLNSKLLFYNTVKEEFRAECYLNIWLTREETRRVAQIRSSSHQLRIETGRYGNLRLDIANRTCPHCCAQDEVDLLSKLPFFDPIIEDEYHFLQTCSLYNDVKKNTKEMTMDLINTENWQELFSHPLHIKEFARYLSRCHRLRFPKEEE